MTQHDRVTLVALPLLTAQELYELEAALVGRISSIKERQAQRPAPILGASLATCQSLLTAVREAKATLVKA